MATHDSRLCLLCAPAGFGKTVLLTEFVQLLPDSHQIIWLSLAGHTLSLEEFLSQVAQGLNCALPAGPPGPALVRLLSRHPGPLCLVLDDYPARASAALDTCIDQLLTHPAHQLHVLVSARQRPSWNLPRLLLAGELMQLDSDELACTRGELQQWVDRFAPRAPTSLGNDLWRETAGWCAGIRLLLSGKSSEDGEPDQTAAQGWVRDYLEHELLARLSPQEVECLRALVHLPRICAELCQQLWEESDGALLFQSLLRQAFFIPLDEEGLWYQVLPVVARGLRGRPHTQNLTQLHLRACRMFIAAGQTEDAIEQALCAGQPEVAANYLERLGQEWLTGEQHLASLLGWRDRLPAVLLDSTPRLLALNAWGLLLAWRLDEAQACIERLAHFMPQPDARRQCKLLANAQALWGSLAALRGDAALAREHCLQALNQFCTRDWMPALLCYSALARVAMASEQPELAPPLLHKGVELARRQGSLLFETLLNLDRIRLLLLRGELGRAQELLHQSFTLISRRNGIDSLMLGRLHLIQAEVHLLQGHLAECENALHIGLKQALACADPFALHGYLGLAELASRAGQFDQAFLHLREAERYMHCAHAWRLSYSGVLNLQRMRIHGRQGSWQRLLPIAARIQRYFQGEQPWIATLDYPALPLRNALLHARAQAAGGQAELAETALQALLERCQALHYQPLALEVQFALVQIRQDQGGHTAALEQETREQASTLTLFGLLQEWPAALPGTASTPPALPGVVESTDGSAPLSQRERSVLQLLAEGFSNQEIGAYLFISVNTVKTHTKKINTKLGVKRRTQAVMRAKSLGLLV
ncbi:MAG: LuxR C-terminal-related transcriptional regulator [Pseudomonas sp.]|uniref:LuxR C-terminal-related transcriptional regulator n=1 Tax=Pseudomonas sp. TaxID=306 RepID=UPI003390E050